MTCSSVTQPATKNELKSTGERDLIEHADVRVQRSGSETGLGEPVHLAPVRQRDQHLPHEWHDERDTQKHECHERERARQPSRAVLSPIRSGCDHSLVSLDPNRKLNAVIAKIIANITHATAEASPVEVVGEGEVVQVVGQHDRVSLALGHHERCSKPPCSPPMVDMITMKKVVARWGQVTLMKRCQPVAPSIAAASYSDCGMFDRPAR